jgi:hypothetical protein
MEQQWNDADGTVSNNSEKMLSQCPPRIPHEQTWARNRASVMRSWQVTALLFFVLVKTVVNNNGEI